MNLGYPGTIGRNGIWEVAARPVKPTDTANIFFGDAVVVNSDSTGGTYSQAASFITLGGTFTLGIFGGFAVREIKSFETYIGAGNSAPVNAYYAPGTACDVIKRGNVMVKCNVGTPTANGPVYIRTVLNGAIPAGVVGGIEAAADGGNTVQLTNCRFFTGLIDANGVAEIEILAVITA